MQITVCSIARPSFSCLGYDIKEYFKNFIVYALLILNQHHLGLQLNDAPHPMRIFGLMQPSFFRSRTDGKFSYSEISEFSVSNMSKKEALKAGKHVTHCFTQKETELNFFSLVLTSLFVRVHKFVRVFVSLCVHVRVPCCCHSGRFFFLFHFYVWEGTLKLWQSEGAV